jgi:osmotically-inducible protein OsmY
MRHIAAMVVVLFTASFALVGQSSKADDRMTDQVRLKLAENPDVNGGAIDVDVKNAVVTLKGSVRTERARSKAESLAKKVKGVKGVDNQLKVDPNAH